VTKKASPATLQDRLEEATPTAIKLKDNDVFVGVFDHLERGETDYGTSYIAVFANPDVSGMLEPPEIPSGGQASIWLFHEALLSQLKRLRPTKGERLGIKRLGQRMGASDRSYIAYSVVSENSQAGQFTWDEVDPATSESTGAFDDPAPF
jgi:hypothetical protein